MTTPQGQIAIVWNHATNGWDLELDTDEGDHLRLDRGLRTAVTISLLTDQRVTAEDLPPSPSVLGGWWGDSYAEPAGWSLGSKLWILRGAKTTQDTLDRARVYIEQALAWLVVDGWVSEWRIQVERVSDTVLGATISAVKPDSRLAEHVGRWEYSL